MTTPSNKQGNDNNHPEQVEINFFGIKFKCSGPTSKTIIILVLWLIFIIILVLLLPQIAILRWIK